MNWITNMKCKRCNRATLASVLRLALKILSCPRVGKKRRGHKISTKKNIGYAFRLNVTGVDLAFPVSNIKTFLRRILTLLIIFFFTTTIL